MATSDKNSNYSSGQTDIIGVAVSVLRPVFAEPGRHSVRIFRMPPEQIVLAIVGTVIVGLPMLFFVGLVPIWDFFGNLPLLKPFHNFVAPVLIDLPDVKLPAYPFKRTMIAIVFLTECYLLGNLLALFSRRVRRQALLVWRCFDREKLLVYLFLSGAAFFALWYFFLYDWRLLIFLLSNSGNLSIRIVFCLVVLFPIATMIFGHLLAIVGIGWARLVYRKVRPLQAVRRTRLESAA